MKVITIGRSTENNNIVVNDEKVSRNHLQMVMDDDGNYSVVDLGSTNGTFVNGQRISGEVRLKLGDEVRIGQTVLPWQNYFATVPQPPIVNPPLPSQPSKPNPNHTWLYIVIGAVLLLLIGGGVAWKIYNDKQKDKVEQEEKKKEQQERQLEQEARDAMVKAARLSEEAETAARKAAESKSEKDRKEAEAAASKAEEAKQLAEQKESEWKKMKTELDAAKKDKEKAEAKSAEDTKAREEAESKANKAQNEANEANKAKEYAEEESRLVKEFYKNMSQVKPSIWAWKTDPLQTIIDDLNWTAREGEDKKDFIIRRFEDGDNAQKQRIINAVKKVLGQQQKESSTIKPAEENLSESAKEPEPIANDTIAKE